MTAMNDLDMNGIEGQMGGSALLPAGTYRCVLVEGNRKSTNKGTGELLELKFSIQGGEYSGSSIYHRLNLWNPSPTATKIAKQEYKYLLDNLGFTPAQISDISQIYNVPIDVKLIVKPYKKNDGTESESNEIADFIQVGQMNTQQQTQQQFQGQPVHEEVQKVQTAPYMQ